MQPFDEKLTWTNTFTKPLRNADPLGVTRLQTLMKLITIRRTKTMTIKGKPIIQLPKREDKVETVILGDYERKLYDAMRNQSREIFENLVSKGNVMSNYVHVLEMMLRLRQIVTHPGLVKKSQMDFSGLISDEDGVIDLSDESQIDPNKVWDTYVLLRDSGEDGCCRCQEQVMDPTSINDATDPRVAGKMPQMSRCLHLYCKSCVEVGFKAQRAFSCAMCGQVVSDGDLLELTEPAPVLIESQPIKSENKTTIKLYIRNSGAGPVPSVQDPNKLELLPVTAESAKVKAIIGDLSMIRLQAQQAGAEEPKSVVFSQWTGMLDILELHLRQGNFRFTRLDGKMTRPERANAIQTFRSDPWCTVMLVSLKAGGVGLNLTMASRAYLVEPYWNPSVENQAVDRIHRLGQTKEVTTIRVIVKDSIEENILALQQKKLALANMALDRTRGKAKGSAAAQREENQRERLKDLK